MLFQIESRERFNTYSHLLAGLIALCSGGILIGLSVQQGSSFKVTAFSIYTLTSVGLFWISALYHGNREPKKSLLRKFDYLGIYLKIAGNYTPYALLVLSGWDRRIVFGGVWGFAVFGFCCELYFHFQNRRLALWNYLIMSVTVLLAYKDFVAQMPSSGLWMILGGFMSYGLGVISFLNDEKWKYGHEVWHVCVMLASFLHFLPLLLFVV